MKQKPKLINNLLKSIQDRIWLEQQQSIHYKNLSQETKDKIEQVRKEAAQEEIDRAEKIRVRKLTHPNLPEQAYKPYSYMELMNLRDEYEDTHPFEIALMLCGIKAIEEDINLYYGGDETKATYYPKKLNWISFTIIIDGKILTDEQREINNLHKLKYVSKVSKTLVPVLPKYWRNQLKVFTEIHNN